MTEPILADVMKRAAFWPAEDQLKLAAAAGIIEAQRQPGHDLDEADWAIIDARLARDDLATDEEAAAFFATHRSA